VICSKLEEFVHIGCATKWIHNLSVFLVSVGQQGLPRALDLGKLAKDRKTWDWWKKYYTLSFD